MDTGKKNNRHQISLCSAYQCRVRETCARYREFAALPRGGSCGRWFVAADGSRGAACSRYMPVDGRSAEK